MLNQEKSYFKTYQLSEDLLQTLDLLGYHQPTKIQQEVIPVMLSESYVVVKAPTGSGKTAAFSIPICEHVVWEENLPQALVLEPTRELTVQVKEEMFLIGRKKRLKVQAAFGGFPIDKQIQSLKQKSHVVVGTPGRIMDHLRRDSLKLGMLKYLVIDEADLMLDMGFIDEVKQILSLVPKTCRISLFSATLQPEIEKLAEGFMGEATQISLEAEGDQKPLITEKLYETDSEHKYEDFRKILIDENPKCCMVFCGTREMVNVLFQKLRRDRIFCGMLHGEMDQRERLKTVEAFRMGGFRFLIATDVAARGIDFEGITHVVNYDFPTGRETYVHRIGRTGRNGKEGIAVSLVSQEDKKMLAMVEEYVGYSLSLSPSPTPDESQEKEFYRSLREKAERKPRKGDSLNQGITRLSIGGGKKSKMRTGDLVGSICGIEGLLVDDIGIIDIRESLCYVEILNDKGNLVLEALQTKPVKGKIRKVRVTRGH